MATLTKTRELVDQLKDHMSEAARTSFLGIIDAFENGRFGRMDALLQLQLTTMGPAAGADPGKMKEIVSSFEAEAN